MVFLKTAEYFFRSRIAPHKRLQTGGARRLRLARLAQAYKLYKLIVRSIKNY